MHEVEVIRNFVVLEIPAHVGYREVAPERDQRFEAEDGVVEVAAAVAILEAAVGIQPG